MPLFSWFKRRSKPEIEMVPMVMKVENGEPVIESEPDRAMDVECRHDWESVDLKLSAEQLRVFEDIYFNAVEFKREDCDTYRVFMGRDVYSYFERGGWDYLSDKVCLKCGEINRYNTDRVVDVIRRYEAWKEKEEVNSIVRECRKVKEDAELAERRERAKAIVDEREGMN